MVTINQDSEKNYDGFKGFISMNARYTKDKLKYKDEITELIDKYGHRTKNDMNTTALFNEYFVSVFTKEDPINFEIDCREPSQPNELPTINKKR